MDSPTREIVIAVWIFLTFMASASSCPPSCQCDSALVVSCAGTNQTAVPIGIPTATRFLHLERNNIELIQENTFSNLKELQELVLTQNRLYEIESGAFTGLANLKKLSLDENVITVLPAGIFAPLTRLTELKISGNRFPVIPQKLFGSMGSLERLFINGNQVDLTIESEAFLGLANLTELSLRLSRIKRLTTGTFSGLLNILRLDLSFNNFDILTRDVIKDLSHLQHLKLNSNVKLTTIEADTFADLKSLIELNISACSLAAIDRQILKGLTSLEQIHLSDNSLRGVDEETFCESPNLLLLELDGNPIENLEVGSFKCLNRLGYLNLNHTKIGRIEERVFEGLDELVVISLSSSGIVGIASDAFQNKSSLTQVDLNDNDIEGLNISLFEGSPNIKALRLQNNRIKTLSEDIFSRISGPLELSLKGNPLVCDCRLDWIPGWLMSSGGFLDRCECDQPPAVHGLHVDYVSYDDFHCKPFVIADLPQVYNAYPGDKKFELICPVDGKPPPSITWTTPSEETLSKKTTPTYENGLYRVRENETLVIREISTAVEGQFTCEGRNNLGHVSVLIDVRVIQTSTRWMVAFIVVLMVFFICVAVGVAVLFLRPKGRRRRRELTRTPARRVDPRYGPLGPIAEGNEAEDL